MARKLFRLGLDPASYNPVGLRSYSDAQLQTEYARIQKEARVRLESLRKSEYGRASETYKKNKGRYPALSKIQDRRQLERAIQEGALFLASPKSTASGLQEIAKKQLETLGEHGYSWITRPMLQAWGEFLKWLGENGGKELFYHKPTEEPDEETDEEDISEETQKQAFYRWSEENGYLTYKTVTRRGKEVEKEVWYK